MMLVQVCFLVWAVLLLREHFAFVCAGLLGLNAVLIVYITNRNENPSYKMAWLIIIAILPIFGGLAYLYLKTRLDSRQFFKRYEKKVASTTGLLKQDLSTLDCLKDMDQRIFNLSYYVEQCGFPIYTDTAVTYFPLGEDQFLAMKEELRRAKKFIFIEYFIVSPGKMWGELLEILKERASAGVEIRLMYDGIGTQFFVPKSMFQNLSKYGIQCKVFNPFRPFLSSAQNNRDHRKILVIDGHTAFNGGTNIADEYINELNRFGHWKDTAVMLKGAAVRNFTLMFLHLWDMSDCSNQNYEQYLQASIPNTITYSDGFVQPFGDDPINEEHIGDSVYLELIHGAKRYVYIETPYLIPDYELLTALQLAAKKGVDVRIITPYHEDKWYCHMIAWKYYQDLLGSGVKIYEYTPGFIHAKCFVVDDEIAVLGTINLDFRSLYLHFECATLFYRNSAIQDMLHDFLLTQEKSQQITLEDCHARPLVKRACSYFLALLSPML